LVIIGPRWLGINHTAKTIRQHLLAAKRSPRSVWHDDCPLRVWHQDFSHKDSTVATIPNDLRTSDNSKQWKQVSTSNDDNPEAQLKIALEAFEVACLRPIVAGELHSWVEHLKEEWCKANRQIEMHTKELHPRQYDEIAKQDPELFARIDQMRAEDALIDGERARVDQSVVRLAEHLPKMEPDEEKAKVRASTFVDEASAFLARVRKQMVAVQTWYIEAFNRDGGAVD